MPYNPTKKQKEANRKRYAKAMSDDELEQSVALSDADIVGPDNEPVVDDRDWKEKAQGYILNLLNLPTFGFADELVAAGGELLGQGKYDDLLKDVEKKHQRYRDLEDDWSAGNIGTGAAGLVLGAPVFNKIFDVGKSIVSLGGKVVPKTAAGKILQNVGALGATGSIAGEIQAVGDAPSGGRWAGYTSGARTIPEVAAVVVPRVVTNAALGATIGAVAPAITRTGQRIFQSLRSPKDKAGRYLAEKFIAAGKTPEEMQAEFNAAHASGKPVAVVDIAPQGVRDAGTASARMPGPGRDRAMPFLEQRQQGQTARVQDDIEKALGKKPGSYTQSTDDISTQRAAEAKPHYDKAFETPKPVTTPKIVELTNRPSGKEAINRGLKMAQDEGIPMEQLVIRDSRGNIIGYTVKALHYGKMALDDMIEAANRSGNTQAARNLTKMKSEWLKEMDAVSPDYARGRKIFAGHSANQSALDKGRKAVNAHPDQIKADMDGMSASERQFYQQGYMQKVVETVESSPDKANAVNRIFGTQAKRDRMRAILGDEKYNELATRFGIETKMNQTYVDVAGGSQTAQRVSAQEDMNTAMAGMSPEAAAGFWRSFVTGDISPLINAMGMRGVANLLQGISQQARGEIVRMLFSTDPNEVRMALQFIAKHYKAAKRFNEMQRTVGSTSAANDDTRVVGGTASMQAGGEVAGAINPL